MQSQTSACKPVCEADVTTFTAHSKTPLYVDNVLLTSHHNKLLQVWTHAPSSNYALPQNVTVPFFSHDTSGRPDGPQADARMG